MESFAERLSALRRSARLTQKQLADFLGVDRSVYAMYETGKLVPAPRKPEMICDRCAASSDARRMLETEAEV